MISTPRALLKALSSSIGSKNKRISDKINIELEKVSLQEQHFKVNYDHYAGYEYDMQWSGTFTHPCYLQMVALPLQLQLLSLPECPVKPVGLVHIHNRIIQSPNFKLGQPFDFEVKFGKLFNHPKGLAIEVVLTASQEQHITYTAIGTYLQRSSHAYPHLPDAEHLPYLQPQPGLIRRKLTQLPFNANSGRLYANVSGDFNPIHLSLMTAKLFGFKRAIAHGMASLAMVISHEEAALRFYNSDLPLELDCDFLKPIYLPSVTQIVTGCIETDRFISLHSANDEDIVHLLIRYARGEATRLYRGIA